MNNSSFHHANTIAQSVQDEMKNMQTALLDVFKENEPPTIRSLIICLKHSIFIPAILFATAL